MRGDPGISGSPLFVVCSGLLLLPAVPARRYGIFFCQLFHLAAFACCSGTPLRYILLSAVPSCCFCLLFRHAVTVYSFVSCSILLLLRAVPARRYGIFFCQLFHLAAFTRCLGRLFRQICNRSIYLTIAVLSYRFSIGLTALSPIIVVSPEDFCWTNRIIGLYRS